MSMSYSRLFKLLESKGLNKSFLRNNGIHANTVDRLIHNKSVNTDILDRICKLLGCRIEDIVEYVPDDK